VCITERCSSIKNQTIQIGPVKVITDPLFLEGDLYVCKANSDSFILCLQKTHLMRKDKPETQDYM